MSEKIEIKELNKFYGKKQALANINLKIEQGMFGLLGRNGAGKTTLMKTLATLHSKNSGSITVCGIPIENAKEIRGITGYLPQEFSMYSTMRVEEALDYLAVLSGLSKEQRKKRVKELIQKVNLVEHKNKKVKALSGGMKRRLGIASALICDPKVLIVDEPTAGLDPEERIRFRNLLCEVACERIVILSTHIVGDIEATCEKIGILDNGKLIYQGTVSDLLEKAQGSVYEINVPKSEIARIKKDYIVTTMLSHTTSATMRIVSETPIPGASLCQANVEDSYVLFLHQNGLVSNDGGEIV